MIVYAVHVHCVVIINNPLHMDITISMTHSDLAPLTGERTMSWQWIITHSAATTVN